MIADRRRVLVLQVADDLAEAEHAHGDDDEADAVGQLRHIEREALGAGVHVGADQAQEEAEHDHADRVEQRALRQHDRRDQAEDHEREVLGRPELERERGERRANGGDQERGDGAGEERADRPPWRAPTPARPCRAIW